MTNRMTLWNPLRRVSPRDLGDFFDFDEDFEPLSGVPMDVYEEGDNIVAELEVPGFEKDQLDIRVEGNQLIVSGNVEDVQEDKGKKKKYYRKEMRNLSFTRSCDLPVPVDSGKADATFREGILRITLPKKEEAKPKQIDIKVR